MSFSVCGILNGCFWHRSCIHPPNQWDSSSQLMVLCAGGVAGEVLHELQETASLCGVNSSGEYTSPSGKKQKGRTGLVGGKAWMKWIERLHNQGQDRAGLRPYNLSNVWVSLKLVSGKGNLLALSKSIMGTNRAALAPNNNQFSMKLFWGIYSAHSGKLTKQQRQWMNKSR